MPLEGRLLAGLVQPKQTVTITLPSPQEELLATPEALPTAEPATSQIVFTIQEGNLPSLPPGATCIYTALLYAAVKNNSASSVTVYYRLLKNGSSVATGSAAVASGYFCTWTFVNRNFYDVKAGDILECRLWAAATGVVWDYKALAVCPTRIRGFWRDKQLLIGVLHSTAPYPDLTLGRPNYRSKVGYYYHYDVSLGSYGFRSVVVPGTLYSLYRVYWGDVILSGTWHVDASYRPYYRRNYVQVGISYYPLWYIAP